MTLATNISSLVTRVGTEFKAIRTLISGTGTGGVGSLTTTATNLVAAINEVKAAIPTTLVTINDTTASATTVYSSTKTDSQIQAGVAALVAGAPAALDTLNELAVQLAADQTGATALTARVTAIETGVGSYTVDYVAAFDAAIA